ncbi:phage protease [Shewanella halotolerans]|uniref:phage protease n=1 Tax=Shewanella halotolerans TaxID=2864204 RepID=UPI0021ABC31A|nr:phage protease [Shewanella halotolerans]
MPAISTALGGAALSSQLNSIVTATFEVAEHGYIQALPDGLFAAVDGRPEDFTIGKWLMDDIAFAAMQANTPHKAGDLVIDYEHQTLNKEKNGQPMPTSGWFCNISKVRGEHAARGTKGALKTNLRQQKASLSAGFSSIWSV